MVPQLSMISQDFSWKQCMNRKTSLKVLVIRYFVSRTDRNFMVWSKYQYKVYVKYLNVAVLKMPKCSTKGSYNLFLFWHYDHYPIEKVFKYLLHTFYWRDLFHIPCETVCMFRLKDKYYFGFKKCKRKFESSQTKKSWFFQFIHTKVSFHHQFILVWKYLRIKEYHNRLLDSLVVEC